MHCEVIYVIIKHTQDTSFIPEFRRRIEMADEVCDKHLKSKGDLSRENIIVLAAKVAHYVKQKDSGMSKEIFSDLVAKMLDKTGKNNKSYVPSVKMIFPYYCKFIFESDIGNETEAKKTLEEFSMVLSKMAKSTQDPFTVHIYRAFIQFSFFRMAYQDLEKVGQDFVESERKKAEMKKKAEAAAIKTVAEEIIEIGDVNPYVINLNAQMEEQLQDLAKQTLECLQEAVKHAGKTLSVEVLDTTSMFRMIGVIAQFFQLNGCSKLCIISANVMFDLAKNMNNLPFQCLAAAFSIQIDLKVGKFGETVQSLNTMKNMQFEEMYCLSTLAWLYYYRSSIPETVNMAQKVLDLSSKLKLSSSFCRIIQCSMKLLLSRVACSSEALSENLGLSEETPLQLNYEAYREVVTCVRSLPSQNGSNLINIMLAKLIAAELHLETLKDRTEYCTKIGIPRELKLYGGLQSFEVSQKLALPLR